MLLCRPSYHSLLSRTHHQHAQSCLLECLISSLVCLHTHALLSNLYIKPARPCCLCVLNSVSVPPHRPNGLPCATRWIASFCVCACFLAGVPPLIPHCLPLRLKICVLIKHARVVFVRDFLAGVPPHKPCMALPPPPSAPAYLNPLAQQPRTRS